VQMSEKEIVKNYKEAADKRNQIKILADMNCCSKEEIKDILRDNGIPEAELGKKGSGRPPKAKPAPTAKETVFRQPKPNEEEQKRADRMNAIPSSVRIVCTGRIAEINKEIEELLEEKESISAFLNGKEPDHGRS